MVLGLCRLLLRDHHEAEDAAQQTFVSAYRSLLRGNEPRDDASWLAAIARNECRARIRKRMRAPIAIDGEIVAQVADPSDITETADRRRELAEITVALADLPIRQREAIALRDFLGLSYEEVASTLSVSVPVVESLLFRARRRLRDTVRTVPRYAAGVAALPLLAMRGIFSRDAHELDTIGSIASLIGGAGAAIGAGVGKLVSLPFAAKAATAVAVVAAGTAVAPLIEDPGTIAPPTGATPAALDSGSAAPSTPGWTLVAPGDQPAQTSEPAKAAPAEKSDAVSAVPDPPPPPPEESNDAASASPDRLSAAAPGGDAPSLTEPVAAEDVAAAACAQAADEGAPAKGWDDAASTTGDTGDCAAPSTEEAAAPDAEAPADPAAPADATAEAPDATAPADEAAAEPVADPSAAPADGTDASVPADTP